MIQTKTNKMFVQLSSSVDEFRFEQLSFNAKMEGLLKPNGSLYYEVPTLKAASALCQKFIKEFNLGSSNWSGGLVVDDDFIFIARVSYNGRVWDNEDWKISKEIKIC